jgi:hypothetical protein
MILIIHIVAVLFSLSVVLTADHYGYSWISGHEAVLKEEKLKKLHMYTWIGILMTIMTGGILFYKDYETLLSSQIFLVKLAFVGTLVVNSFSVGILKDLATKTKFSNLSIKEKTSLFISGGTSSACWLGALLCAFFIY